LRPQTGQTNTVSATYKYGDNFRFAYGISPEGGNLAALGYEKALPALGSQYNFDRVFFDWRRYMALPWQHHALALRMMGGTNVGPEAGAFFLGGSESATLLSNADLRTVGGVGTRFLPLRGYGFAAQSGPSAAMLAAEWRFPIYAVQRGYGIYPAFIRNVHGAVFAEAGHAWRNAPNWREGLADVGLELRAQAHLQQAPTEVRLGIGQGLVSTGRGVQWPNVFVELGTFF
jgi:outer membrane protein assembly factor BamA